MKKTLSLTIGLALSIAGISQIVETEPYLTLKASKSAVKCFAISPKGDAIAVGLGTGAEVFDLSKGKKLYALKHEAPDGDPRVNWVQFNENGEYLCTVDYKGKRKVWKMSNGKEDTFLPNHKKWLPEPLYLKNELNLSMNNKAFDRHYTQKQAPHPRNKDLKAIATIKNEVEFHNLTDGSIEQDLKFVDVKDKQHVFPVYFSPDAETFVTGNDKGEVFLYKVKGKGSF